MAATVMPPFYDQISELKKKIHLYEVNKSTGYESSKTTTKQNQETILQLRVENKRLNKRLALALRGDEQDVRDVFQSRSEKAAFRNMSTEAAIEVLNYKVCKKNNKLNDLNHITNKHQQKLEELKAQYENLTAKRKDLKAEETSKNLRMLENDVVKAQLKFQEAGHIMKSYLKLKEHLQEESLDFEPQLNKLEAEILRQRQEFFQLLNMNHLAHMAKEEAKTELQQQKEQVDQEQKKRNRILNQYKKQLEEYRVQTEGGESRAQPVALHPNEPISEAHCIAMEDREENRVLSIFEKAFQRLREAAGVTNTQEVIDKTLSQKDTHEYLEEMKMENEAKLQQLKKTIDTLDAYFHKMKYSGENILSSAQQELKECENRLQAEQQKQVAAKEKLNWLTQTLSTICVEVNYLSDKLQHITLPQSEECVQSDTAEGVVKLLQEAEHKLLYLQGELQDKDLNALLKQIEDEEFLVSIEGKLPQYSSSITLPDTQKPNISEEEEDSDVVEGDFITRESLKHQAQLLIDFKTRGKTRGKL